MIKDYFDNDIRNIKYFFSDPKGWCKDQKAAFISTLKYYSHRPRQLAIDTLIIAGCLAVFLLLYYTFPCFFTDC